MNHGRIYNFSSGPAMMPEPVLEEIREEMLNYRGTGMCVMEMSHRSPEYRAIAAQTEADLRSLLDVPSNYRILFIQGGGTLEFSAIPINLLKSDGTGTAVYIETGSWSVKAENEAKRYGNIVVGASSADRNFTYVPDCSNLAIPQDADYVYICENETIHGVCWNGLLPDTKGKPLVADQSSMFLSKPCNVSDYGVIWAGVQKNLGPAGMAVVIIREDLIREDLNPQAPLYLRFDTHARSNSGYNTPNTWSMYCCGKVIRYLMDNGGLEAQARRNEEKAKVLYDYLDSSRLFYNPVEKDFRSVMNIPFVTGDKEQEAQVIKEAKAAGLTALAGHPSVGGLRASLYNAMPKEGAESLVSFLRDYERKALG